MPPYQFSSSSVACVTVASKPLLGMAHEPTFSAPPQGGSVLVTEEAGRLIADVSFEVDPYALDPGPGHSRFDSEKMKVNLAGNEVLEASRYPRIIVKGRYDGSREAGTFACDITLRGSPHHVVLQTSIRQEGEQLHAEGSWEGTLTSLGIKPFRAMLGALTLKDWVRLTFRATLVPA